MILAEPGSTVRTLPLVGSNSDRLPSAELKMNMLPEANAATVGARVPAGTIATPVGTFVGPAAGGFVAAAAGVGAGDSTLVAPAAAVAGLAGGVRVAIAASLVPAAAGVTAG